MKSRHDKVNKQLANALAKVPDLKIREVGHPKHNSTQNPHRAADIRLEYAGTTYMIDVTIASVATDARVRNDKTHLVPGAAANNAYKDKLAKYNKDLSPSYVFLPFAIETGGRIHPKACEFLDSIARESALHHRAIQATYRTVARCLMYQQTWMLKKYADEYFRHNTV